jgi:hypothetical protein
MASSGYQPVRRPPKTRSDRAIPAPHGGHRPKKLIVLSGRARYTTAMRMRVASSNDTTRPATLPAIYSHESGTTPTSGVDRSTDNPVHYEGRKGCVTMAYRQRNTSAIRPGKGNLPGKYLWVSTTPRTGRLDLRNVGLRSSPKGGNSGLNCNQTTRLTGRGEAQAKRLRNS